MSQLKDGNLAQVLGLCTRVEPYSVLHEYSDCGDLRRFLQQHVADLSTTKQRNRKMLRQVRSLEKLKEKHDACSKYNVHCKYAYMGSIKL